MARLALPKSPASEAFSVWALVLLGLALVQALGLAVPLLHQAVGALAVAAFLYAPTLALERRGQDAHDAGWRFDRLGTELAWSLGACAVVLPLFSLAFAGFVHVLPLLPGRSFFAPYLGLAHPLQFRFPHDQKAALDLGGRVLGNAAVAFSEEFFYRGYLTLRLEERWPPRTRILGVPLGRAALLVAVLFAVGHLLEPAPFRLAVFFPALLFAWLRARTGTVVAASICHLICNVWLLMLEQAAY